MRTYMVVAVDNARARFMFLESAEVPELMSGPALLETEVLYNPEERAQDNVLFSEQRTGRNRTTTGAGHGYDDHRQSHRHEFERRFFREVAERCLALHYRRPTEHLILVGDGRILGQLRGQLSSRLNHGTRVEEYAENLAGLAPARLHAHLAREHQLPARRKPERQAH